MAECKTCGAELDGNGVCTACTAAAQAADAPKRDKHSFDSVCGKCGALIPSGRKACIVCHTPRGQVPFAGHFPVEPEDRGDAALPAKPSPGTARKTPDLWRRWTGGMAGLVLLIFAVLGGFGIYREYFDTSSYRALESVIYSTSDGYMLTNPGLEAPRQVTGIEPSRVIESVRSSPNGRWIACTDDAGGLYVLDLARRRGAEDILYAEKIAANLAQPGEFSLGSDYLVYLNDRGELFASDLSESWQLDTGVVEVSAVDADRVLYTRRGDRADELDLYLDLLSKDSGQRNVIERNIRRVLDWTPGFARILYTGTQSDDEGNTRRSLQLFELSQGTTTTLVTGIGRVLDASAEKGSAVYLVARQMGWNYRTFVFDNYDMRDRLHKEPLLEDYPLAQRAFRSAGMEGNAQELSELLDTQIDDEDLLMELVGYREELEQWEDKLFRDEMREVYDQAVQDTAGQVVYGDLYAYHNKEVTLVDTDVIYRSEELDRDGGANAAQGYITYEKADLKTLRRITISEVDREADAGEFSPVDYFFDAVDRSLVYASVESSPSTLYTHTENSTYGRWAVTPGGDGVYFTVHAVVQSPSTGALYYSPVRAGEPGEASIVEREVTDLLWPYRDGVVFAVDEQDVNRLYFAQNGEARPLSGAAARASLSDVGSGAVLYFGFGEDEGSVLYLLQRDERRISHSVATYAYHSEELIYLLKPAASEGSDLYLWQSGRERLVAEKVRGMIWDFSGTRGK